ncbi:MAG: hypothetical protein ACE5MB_11660 [Anaerolineae bacterium]
MTEKDELRRLFIARGEIDYESTPVPEAGLEDIDPAEVRRYVERVKDRTGFEITLPLIDLLR